MPVTIRPLRPDEAASYREIRLEALRAHPDAFGASFEDEAARPLATFAERLTSSVVFAAFEGDTPLGTAGFRADTGPKQAHKGMFWGMYVRPAGRGTGIARRLVEAVLDHARPRVEILRLTVAEGTVPAQKLYDSLGFTVYGVEPRALRVEGRMVNEVLMAKYPI